MNNIDIMIKSLLNNLPKRNSSSLRTYILNVSMMERFEKVKSRFDENESKLFKILNNPSDDLNSTIRSLKSSTKMITQSDNAIERLLKTLK